MDNVKSVTFGFENCDCVTIPSKYIGVFLMEDIHTNISRVACNSISKYITANTVAVEIFKEADKLYFSFGQEDWATPIFKRLTDYNDITSICLTFDDDSEECYWVDYDGEEENPNQIAYTSDLENLYIVICKDKKIEDFFDMEEINNKDYIDFQKEFIME